MIGWQLHFATEVRARDGHVLSSALRHGVAHLDDATELHIGLAPAVDVQERAVLDQDTPRRLETDQ